MTLNSNHWRFKVVEVELDTNSVACYVCTIITQFTIYVSDQLSLFSAIWFAIFMQAIAAAGRVVYLFLVLGER